MQLKPEGLEFGWHLAEPGVINSYRINPGKIAQRIMKGEVIVKSSIKMYPERKKGKFF